MIANEEIKLPANRLERSIIRKLEGIARKHGEEYALDLTVACKACGGRHY